MTRRFALVISLLAAFSLTVLAQKPIARFTATAVNLDATHGRGTGQVEIQINRWSTDAERDQLTSAIKEQSQDKVLNLVTKLPAVGSIRTPDSVGYELRYARASKIGASDRIVILTNRPIDFWERREGGLSTEYPFTMIELRIAANGAGEGKMSVATKLFLDDENTLTLENYGIGPVLLQNVRRDGR